MSTATLDTKTFEESAEAPVLLASRTCACRRRSRPSAAADFSIPTQREANARKSDELGARIIREFINAGESARSADRDGLQDMLALIAATRVQFCIVHKLDRLARNCADDVKTHEVLLAAGVTLVSATESIDQTPTGMLVHGSMSSTADFYSRNLATEVAKGRTQKVTQGGIPGRTHRLPQRALHRPARPRDTHRQSRSRTHTSDRVDIRAERRRQDLRDCAAA